MTWERVYTVTDYYDGPRGGVAEFEGRPHVYVADFDVSADEYADTFRLSPISAQTLALALEDWSIWRRFEIAFHSGQVADEPWGSLPEDRSRHDELASLFRDRLRIDPDQAVAARAEFREPASSLPAGVISPMEVRWTRV